MTAFRGSSAATEVRAQRRPFQCATSLPPTAQTSSAARPLPAIRPRPDGGAVQRCPSQCQAPSERAPKPNPNTQTLRGPGTASPPAARRNWRATDQVAPPQRSTRVVGPGKSRTMAQTLPGDEAAAQVTRSPGRLGNAALCQPLPVS